MSAKELAERIVNAVDGGHTNTARVASPDHHEIFAIQSELQHDGARFDEAWREAKVRWLERLLAKVVGPVPDASPIERSGGLNHELG